MARINLLTIHYGMCYGAVMQTYATCKLLEEVGHIVTVINLVHPRCKKTYLDWRKLPDLIREFQFYLFKRKFFSTMTRKGYTMDDITLPDADVTMVGSDQVWNRDITADFGTTFYLDFVPNTQKKIAFCSSFGKSEWNEDAEYTEILKKEFSKFDAISIREKSGVEIMKNIFGLSSINLQDPTIGYGKFEELVYNKKKQAQIFTFMLNTSIDAQLKAKHIANELGLPLYRKNFINRYLFSGPRHWLTNIHNAEYVITDSFHGLALSIIFHKQFFVFCADPKKFTRLKSLLDLLGLSNRYIDSIEDFNTRKSELLAPIDYTAVDSILTSERDKFKEFIVSI